MNLDDRKRERLLVESHLEKELNLAAMLEKLNQALADIMRTSGLRGPTVDEVQSVEPIRQQTQKIFSEVCHARKTLLQRIQSETGKPDITLREWIASMPDTQGVDLEALRRTTLQRASRAYATLIRNRVAVYYTCEFYKRLVAGIFDTEPEDQTYRMDGQTPTLPAGNLLRKTC